VGDPAKEDGDRSRVVARRTFLEGVVAAGSAMSVAALADDIRLPLRVVDENVIQHFRSLRAVLVDADNLLGPYYPLTIVRQQIDVIDSLRQQARGMMSLRLLSAEARWAEFAGWLYDDIGMRDDGAAWIGRATDMAVEAEDDATVAYLLARRAQRAVLFSRGEDAIQLAVHARRQSTAAPFTRALASVVAASGHAISGDADAARKEIDAARDLVAWHISAEPDGLGAFCSPSYVAVQEGECWLRLGDAERAATVLGDTLGVWPVGFDRDRGLALVRLAAARLAAHDPDGAARAAVEAARVAERTGSVRVFDGVVEVGRSLERWRGHRPVDELLQQLTSE